jgi:hypothetical protein
MNPFLHRFLAFVGFLLSIYLLVLTVRQSSTYLQAVFAFVCILFFIFSFISPPKTGRVKW